MTMKIARATAFLALLLTFVATGCSSTKTTSASCNKACGGYTRVKGN